MKKLIAILVLSSVYSFAFAQEIKEHEVGIGIGYIQLNPYAEHYASLYESKWTFGTIFRQTPFQSGYYAIKDLSISENFTSPVVYYTERISKRSSWRASGQYMYQKGHSKTSTHIDGVFHYEEKKTMISTGYSFKFFVRKYLQAYIGADLELIYAIRKQNEILFEGYICWINMRVNENSYITHTNINFFLSQFAGFRVPISKRINIGYECSAKFLGTELMLRPISRLSVNYEF